MKNLILVSNRFVDRDMFMRYEWGLGVGHTYAHPNATDANEKVLADRRHIQAELSLNPPNPAVRDLGPQPTSLVSQHHPGNATELVGSASSTALDAAGGGDEGDSEVSTDGDDDDYSSDPARDSEDEREAMLFRWGSD